MSKKPERIFVKGNEAIARGALAAKCKCFFGYPITPQNDIPEFMSSEMIKAGGDFVQAESEVAAANMLLGAGAAGVRAMTSSSSPGMSLKQEAISYMAGSEIPAVVVNMNRGGPGLGDIGPAQGDYYQSTRGGGHGDYRHFTLGPGTVQEAYDLTIRAFDIAFKHRTPVLILGDAILGQMKEPITPWTPENVDEEGGRDWAITGRDNGREKRLIKSLFLEEGALAGQNQHLQAKYDSWKDLAEAEQFETEDADLIVCAYGSIGRIAKSAVRKFRAEGKKVGLFRPITLYPFPSDDLLALAKQGKRFLTIEHNLGQMVDDVRLAIRTVADSDFYAIYPGNLPTPDELEEPILNCLEGK
ncbi:MAG: 3-methyl-2-oxobutanoate dehydrogenase subunit VorB [Pseudodesulfovibrio sp.]|jgi:2-oxoglutarate ferredoxin oxidoreductase subunit alpha|uniref:2-ketoisovalerate ferredoxin oxidoreductase n=1 Tax=Pseudodesulfovibrio indicus TaxID=1716143 RepID=A0A126QK01_9BACT|nr:3-methyl-2-oxobutanoate dehydrogenase subunit VorB [Pseudodesulfovibrio indicus]AMK10117.1 2-ketoisovalerate ferredoxin oxidoreductase [Pseudodesulfovibrio indicus]TDT87818.1 2-oxoglutarate ferredoxin oxidoreductase subunit alpha [Pseudodesulfovibrio indicus]